MKKSVISLVYVKATLSTLILLVVTAGNLVGGTLLVAGVYWTAYLRSERLRKKQS